MYLVFNPTRYISKDNMKYIIEYSPQSNVHRTKGRKGFLLQNTRLTNHDKNKEWRQKLMKTMNQEQEGRCKNLRGWLVWSRCSNLKVNGQENLIEFPLDSCPDFILLYMVCVQYWLSSYSMTHLLILSYYSITDLAKHGDPGPTSPYKGWPVLCQNWKFLQKAVQEEI